MQIQVLGSGAYPLRLQDGRSFCLFLPEFNIAIDGGLGLLALPHSAKGEELVIIMTHFHHDHILGLASVNNLLERGQYKFIRILGDERIQELGMFFREPFSPDYGDALPILLERMDIESDIRGLHVTRKQVGHASGHSNMLRLEAGGKRVGIATDTTADVANADFFRNADVLFHECNYDNAQAERAKAEGHSYPEAVVALAQAAGVKRLVLIHTDPRHSQALPEVQQGFPGASAAIDDQVIEV